MPGYTFWLPVIAAFFLAFATGMTAAIVQAQSTGMPLSGLSWLLAVMGGIITAVERGRAVWARMFRS